MDAVFDLLLIISALFIIGLLCALLYWLARGAKLFFNAIYDAVTNHEARNQIYDHGDAEFEDAAPPLLSRVPPAPASPQERAGLWTNSTL